MDISNFPCSSFARLGHD